MGRKFILGIVILMTFFFLQACSSEKIQGAVDWPVEPFEYTDQNGESFSSEELEGKVWLANFIFTNCKTVCPPMTFNMAKLQHMLIVEEIENVEIVSFSVDPEVDGPEELKEFAAQFTDNTENWHFLTGYVQLHIEQFARENFKTIVQKPENDDQVIHGTSFYLVNQEGSVVKSYDGINVPFEEIINDIKILQKQS